jgi:DNA-directed RNA polymerase specialized sigma24 family protein
VARDQQVEDLEQFLGRRGQALLRTAALLTGSIEAGEDLLQSAIERLLRQRNRLDGDPEGSTCAARCATWLLTSSGGAPGGGESFSFSRPRRLRQQMRPPR